MKTLYVTYDLLQQASSGESVVIHGAKKFSMPGSPLHWEIGEHESVSGKKVYGVKVRYSGMRESKDRGNASLAEAAESATLTPHEQIEVIEVPSNAQNVEIHLNEIPAPYRASLRDAA